MELKVECQKGTGSKPRALRRSGLIPANLYGHKGAESIALTLNAKIAETLLKQASINNTLIQVNILNCAGVAIPFCEKFRSILRRVGLYQLFRRGRARQPDVEVPIQFVGDVAGVARRCRPVLTHLQVRLTISQR